MIRTSICALAALTAISTASATDVPVNFDAGKLSDPLYFSAVNAEIEKAARIACRKELRGDPYASSKMAGCVEEASENAKAELDVLAAAAKPTQIAAN